MLHVVNTLSATWTPWSCCAQMVKEIRVRSKEICVHSGISLCDEGIRFPGILPQETLELYSKMSCSVEYSLVWGTGDGSRVPPWAWALTPCSHPAPCTAAAAPTPALRANQLQAKEMVAEGLWKGDSLFSQGRSFQCCTDPPEHVHWKILFLNHSW